MMLTQYRADSEQAEFDATTERLKTAVGRLRRLPNGGQI